MRENEEFERLTGPFRAELLAYCYRMLGSVQDAEDQVQETLLRAWRGYGGFEGRSSVRTWLYRIATNACLRALETRARRPLPSGLGAPAVDPDAPLPPARPEVPWLQPIPDARFWPVPADPAAVVISRTSMRLALIAALQYLPPRQRAVQDEIGEPDTALPGDLRMVPTAANGQPAFAAYLSGPGGVHRAHAIQVLTPTRSGLARIVSFNDPGLFAMFGLQRTMARSA